MKIFRSIYDKIRLPIKGSKNIVDYYNDNNKDIDKNREIMNQKVDDIKKSEEKTETNKNKILDITPKIDEKKEASNKNEPNQEKNNKKSVEKNSSEKELKKDAKLKSEVEKQIQNLEEYFSNFEQLNSLKDKKLHKLYRKFSQKEDRKQVHCASDLFFDRELSWLSFNRRVLDYAFDNNQPLYERIKFLGISAKNLEEFIMVRLAKIIHGLRLIPENETNKRIAVKKRLDIIFAQVKNFLYAQQVCWSKLKSHLSKKGVNFVNPKDVTNEDKKFLREYFNNQLLSVITPLVIDPKMPIPFVPSKGFVLFYQLSNGLNLFIPLPLNSPRFVQIPSEDETNTKAKKIILIEDVISMFLDIIYPDTKILTQAAFQLLRDSDTVSDEGDDLVKRAMSIIKKRRKGDIILLKITENAPKFLYELISNFSENKNINFVEMKGMIGITSVAEIIDKKDKKLNYTPFVARYPERIKEFNGDCFSAIVNKDILVHHPYESFSVVVDYLNQAAADPNVISIKQTLYRTSIQSPIVEALIKAAEAGKNVTALVELQARFDEEANLAWARKMQVAGVHLVYGKFGLKVHAKLSLVVRKEADAIRCYAHIGTGNYHPITANIYTDLSLFTSDPKICQDVSKVFHFITGDAMVENFNHIAMAPNSLRGKICELIDKEIEFAKKKQPANIWIKVNSIQDKKIVNKLYEASSAGVKINIICRGFCCLKPQVKGLSENIKVKSIVGRFLEHSRIFCFGNGSELPSKNALIYITSADLMKNKLNKRVELLCPILNETVHKQVLEQIMVGNMLDNTLSWELNSDGSYNKIRIEKDQKKFNTHDYFMTNPSLSGRGLSIKKLAPKNLWISK